MATARDLLRIAEGYVGIKEFPPDSNRVQFNTRYYGREVSGSAYPWCCVFQWCLFQDAGAPDLFFGGGKTASCTTLYQWYRQRGQTVPREQARPGDLVFFVFDGNSRGIMNHIGICESCAGGSVTTIDGNTGTTSEANGGAVMRRRRALKYVGGVARPDYAKEEPDMTEKDVLRLIDAAVEAVRPRVYTDLAQVPEWAQALVGRAMDAGIVKGDGGGKLRLTDDNLVSLQMLANANIF